MLHRQRSEANAWFNGLTCAPFLIIIVLTSFWINTDPSLEPFAIVIFPMIIVFGIIDLWIPSKVLHHWYLEIDEQGVLYDIFGWKRFFPWEEVVELEAVTDPHFTGGYNDTLILRTKDSTLSFFLHDFGLDTKRETTEFIDEVMQYWNENKHFS